MYCPPPRRLEITKVDTAGINTIVIPDITPGRLRGNTTLVNICFLVAPRSLAASIKLWSIFDSIVNIGNTIKGKKLYIIPSNTAPSLYKNCIGPIPKLAKKLFTKPFLPRIGNQA